MDIIKKLVLNSKDLLKDFDMKNQIIDANELRANLIFFIIWNEISMEIIRSIRLF